MGCHLPHIRVNISHNSWGTINNRSTHPNIKDPGARRHHVSGDNASDSGCCHHHIGAPDQFFKVAGLRVSEGDRGIKTTPGEQ
jgi:hypothetical protein